MSDRRIAIEREALRLFAQKGVAAVSTREIAQAVGIGESGLYRHMTSKEDLARRVFDQAYRAFAGELRGAVSGLEDDFPRAVRAVVEAIYTAFDRDPVLLRFLVLRQHDVMAELELGADNPVDVVAHILERAIGRGEVEIDPRLALALLMGVVLQPMTNALYERLDRPVVAHTDAVAAAALRALNFVQEMRT